jgi:hypothetical protein
LFEPVYRFQVFYMVAGCFARFGTIAIYEIQRRAFIVDEDGDPWVFVLGIRHQCQGLTVKFEAIQVSFRYSPDSGFYLWRYGLITGIIFSRASWHDADEEVLISGP